MKKSSLQFTVVLLAAGAVFAAAPAALAAGKTFEVASIKLSPPPTDGRVMISMGGDAGRIDWHGVPLKLIIANAYEVKDFQISGPDFLLPQRFEVSAKFPQGSTRDDVPEMLRALLEDRFKLKVHKETKEASVYVLTVAKGGSKLKEADAEMANQGQVRMGMGQLDLAGVPITQLSTMLARMLDRPVLDQTELKGNYNVKLQFTPEPGMGGGMRAMAGAPPPGAMAGGGDHGGSSSSDGQSPSIFTALQEQAGLKLEAKKAPVEQLIVDKIEKLPTEN